MLEGGSQGSLRHKQGGKVYSYAHAPTIQAFTRSKAKYRALMGPFGSGKSTGAGPIEILKKCMAQPQGPDGIRRSRWAVVRNTKPMLKQTILQTFLDWYTPEGPMGHYQKAEMIYYLQFDDIVAEVWFLGLDDEKDLRKLYSLEISGAYLEEARELPENIFTYLKGRIGRYPKEQDGGCPVQGLWLATNPPEDSHWIPKMFDPPISENFEFFRQPSGLSDKAENIPFLTEGYYDNLCEGTKQEFIDVYVHGKYGFVQDGQAVFPEWNDTYHVNPDIKPHKDLRVITGWDWGLTPVVLLGQETASGRLIIFDEIVSKRMGAKAIAKELVKRLGRDWPDLKMGDAIGDPAGGTSSETDERSCFDMANASLSRYGVMIEGGVQTVEHRLEAVRWGLTNFIDGFPALQVHPRCKVLISALRGKYKYRKLRIIGPDNQYHDRPEKSHPYSDVADALQYMSTHIWKHILLDESPQEEEEAPEYLSNHSSGVSTDWY